MKPDWFKLAEEDGYPERKISGYLKRKGSGFFRPFLIFLGAVGALFSVLFITPPELGKQPALDGNDFNEILPSTNVGSTNPTITEPLTPEISIGNKPPSSPGVSGLSPGDLIIDNNPGAGKILSKNGDFTGSSVSMQYGTVQVRITVKEGKITDVVALKAPSGSNLRYTNMSVPVLIERVLKSQSASIQGVSGASYTSESFKKSLQYAISLSRASNESGGAMIVPPPTVSLGGLAGGKSSGGEDEDEGREEDEDEGREEDED